VIESFGNALAENLFDDKNSKATKAFPPELRRVARRKLQYLHEAADLRTSNQRRAIGSKD
jgi:proteic killer suppression protein